MNLCMYKTSLALTIFRLVYVCLGGVYPWDMAENSILITFGLSHPPCLHIASFNINMSVDTAHQ